MNNINKIENITLKVFNIKNNRLSDKTIKQELAYARYVFCHILYSNKIIKNVSAIGRYLNRNHATILNALKRHDDLMVVNKEYQRNYKLVLDAANRQVFKCQPFDLHKLFKRIDISNRCNIQAVK